MIEVRLPLTSAQLGVWTAEHVTPGADAFRISQLIWLDGDIDTPLLERAIGVATSEADVLGLRPVEGADGLPMLHREIGGVGTTTVVEHDRPDDRIRAEAWTRCHECGAGDDRFESVSVIHRRADGWAWEFATHHLLLDAYGLGLVTRRVAEVYTALVGNEPIPPRWFGAYSEIEESRDTNLDDHWVQRFEAVDDITPVTFDASRQFFLTDARTHVVIPADVAESIDQLARAARVNWSDVVALGWGLYTASLVGRDAFAVRFPQMNRSGRPALTTPAMLVGAAPVVFRPNPSATVRELLQQVNSELRTAARHVAAGEKLARIWPNGPDDYQAIPQLNIKAFDYNQSFGAIRGRQETIASGPVGFLDLMAYRDSVHGFLVDVATSDPAVAASGVVDTANRFVQFLGRLAAAPGTRIASVRVIDADLTLSAGPVVSVADSTVDALTRRQSSVSADALAVIDDSGTEFSYTDFDARVNALAHVLIERGVQVGDRVAVQLPRSIELVTALHAVIRAGAAYVPIDPDYPDERIGHILDDASPTVVITEEFLDNPVVAARLARGERAAPVLARTLTPADIAYVLFTSGTTGRPKGVMISHQAIINRLTWMADDYAIGPGDRILQKTPAVFDVSVWEFFLPAVIGATLVIAKDGGHKDPSYLAEVIDRHHITVLHFVPAMLAAFLGASPDPDRLASVRRVFFSGEALPAPNAAAADRLFTGAELHNLYGPTEAAVDVTAAPVHASALADLVTVPIGVPVANTIVRVLDSWLRPVPTGVTGELYLGGIQLADGYIARPDLTATRFIADPTTDPTTGTASGQRLYRTGDLVRWNTGGHLEYLGRSDDQVKIRGFRIELDEIRTVLEQHPAVSRAVVIAAEHPAHTNSAGTGTYLAAYHTSTTDTEITEATDGELRAFLTDRLPDYMIPTVFIPIDTIPVTPNGKLDRRALPTPDLTGALTGGQHPTTVTETTLATVFADVLHLPTDTELSIDDDFFRLGGDSISSIQVVTRARRAGITITAADIFTHRTIATLATIADTRTHTESGPTAVTTAPLLPIAARYINRPGFDHFTQSFVFTTPPDLTTDTLHRILTRVIGHHPTLQGRLGIDNSGAPHFTGAATPIEVTTRLDTTEFTDGWSGPRWPAYVTAETTRLSEQLDPTNGILWRALWCTHSGDTKPNDADSGDTKPNDADSGDTTGRLVMVIHHLAVDGVSWRILEDDLAHAWALDTDATDTDLLPAGTSITTWTHALTEQDVTEQLGHWSTVVNAVVPLFGETGIDQERHTQATVTTIDVKIPAGPLINDVTAALSASVEDILLTALTIATDTWRARHHLEPLPITIGMEGHGRQETLVPGADLSRSIGWFTTWYPILADLTDLDPHHTITDPTLAADAVLRIKDTLARIPDRGIGYGILTHLDPDTALPTTTPDLAFNYLGNFSAVTAKPWSNSPECPGIRAHLPKNLPAAAVVDVNIAVLTGSDGEPMFDGSFAYAQDILTSEQARELVQLWTTALQTLVTYATGVGAGRVRRSLTDFTATGIIHSDLTAWEHRYGDITDVQPLTPLQHGMVFESLLGDSASVDLYLTHTLVHVTGTLDNERLYRALRTLTEIYPNLKAAITPAANGDYVAVIPTHATIELTAVNGIGDADAVDKAVARNRETGFVLADALLMRVTAVTTAPDHHTLILTIHHAITDGWSTPPLIATLLRAYNTPTT
ncbi:hypothetical protein CH284_19680, partial [Rhodococcus sp. 06-156-3]